MSHVNGRVEPDDIEDLAGWYLREVADTQLLTTEQEVELAKRIEAGVYDSLPGDSG